MAFIFQVEDENDGANTRRLSLVFQIVDMQLSTSAVGVIAIVSVMISAMTGTVI